MADESSGATSRIAALDRAPACDVDAAALAARCARRLGGIVALEPLLDQLFRDWIPLVRRRAGYLAFIPGAPLAALADFIADATNRYTGVWRAAPARAARGQRARLAARLDGVSAGDEGLFTPAARWPPSTPSSPPGAAPRRRHPPRRALRLRSGAPLGAEISEARRRHAGSGAADRVRRSLSDADRSADRGRRRGSPRRPDTVRRRGAPERRTPGQ